MKLNLKSILTGSAATVALLAASSANASGYYVGLFGGISSVEDDFAVSTATSTSSSTSASKEVFKYTGGINNAGFTATWAQWSWDTKPNVSPTAKQTAGPAYGTFQASTNTGQPLRAYVVYQSNTTLSGSTTLNASHSFDDGFVVGGSIGWDFGNGWRTEIEAAYRSNDVSSSAVNGVQSWAFNRNISNFGIFRIPYSQTYYSKFATYVGLNYITYAGTYKSFTSKSQFGVNDLGSGKGTFGSKTQFTDSLTGAGQTHYINNGLTVDNHLGKTGSAGSKFMGHYGSDFKNTIKDSGTAVILGMADGELETWSFMMNVWYDFDFGDSPIRPFVGGGIGFAHASLEYDFTATLPSISQTGYSTVDISSRPFAYRGNGEATDWGFAYQVGAGLGYDLGNGMMLSAQYRYFNTGAMDLSLADQIEVNLESHNFLVGLNIPLGGGM